MGFAIGGIAVFRSGAAQVVAVKAAILQNFAKLEPDSGSLGQVYFQAEDASLILTDIQHDFSRGRVQQGGRQLFPHSDRCAQAGGQHSLWRLDQGSCHRRQSGQGVIQPFAIVDVGKKDIRAGYLPVFVGADDFGTAVGVVQVQFGDQLPLVAVVRLGCALVKMQTKTAFVPAVSQRYRQDAILLHLPGNVIGLILHPAVVVCAVGGQQLIADFPAVPRNLIQTKATDVQPSGGHRLCDRYCPAKNRMAARLIPIRTADPFTLP